MKLTKSRLRRIIREEISYLFEVAEKDHEKGVPTSIAKKESQDGLFIDLVSLVELITGGREKFAVRGVDHSGSRPQPTEFVVSITTEDPVESLSVGQEEDMDKVFVPSELYGKSFNIADPTYGEYNFIVEP